MVEIITKEISRATMVEIITKEISRATMVEIITVGVSRGYTDHHQGRAIHMADSRIH